MRSPFHWIYTGACAVLVVASRALPMSAQTPANDPRAAAVVNKAITRMGGEELLRSVHGVRMDIITQWNRTHFSDHPFADYPSFERNTELRDYAKSLWRNTRDFFGGAPVIVVVNDSVCTFTATRPDGTVTTSALNVAYRDERRELFNFAPERMLLVARDAGGLKMLTDTSIAGVVHARVATTVDGYPATYFISRRDDLPAMVRFRADEDNDFGLAPWGMMEVEFWFSSWSTAAPGIMYPRQRDVMRVGKPYKRMSVRSMTINPPTPADSFAVTDSIRSAFYATQNRPMYDVPMDTLSIVADAFVGFPPQLGSSGALRIGGGWVLFETGQAAGAATRIDRWMQRHNPKSPIIAGIASYSNTSNGGIRWFAEHKLPVYAPSEAAPMHRVILGAQGVNHIPTSVRSAQWVKMGTDSLWLEPIIVPDIAGVIAAYSPTHKWLYLAMAGAPIVSAQQTDLIARLRSRGWPVEWIGSARAFRAPAPK